MGESAGFSAEMMAAIALAGITVDEAAANIRSWSESTGFAEYLDWWDLCMAARETPPDEKPSGGE